MENHLISIIIPVYKVEHYLCTCVDSVLNQKFNNWELILVDDGSPDNCPKICDEYAAKDKRIKVIHKENGGASDARNFGINVAGGSYLLFLDSDDYWSDNDFLSGLNEIIKRLPEVDVVNFGWINFLQNSRQFIEEKRNFSSMKEIQESNRDYISKLIENDLFVASPWNKCIKRQFIIENNLYFKKGIRSEDMDWCGRILYLMPSMLCYNNKSYVYRQQVCGSITSNVGLAHISDIILMVKAALNQSCLLKPDDRFVYLSFFATQYLTLLINLNPKILENKRKTLKEVKELKLILGNDLNYKVKTVNRYMKILGFRLMSTLLRQYVLIRKS